MSDLTQRISRRAFLWAQLDTAPVSLSPPERGEGFKRVNILASSPRPSPPLGAEREKTGAVHGYAHSFLKYAYSFLTRRKSL